MANIILPGATAPDALMSQMGVKVADEGELVVLTIGNVSMKMSYEAALKISGWMRMHAKKAKRTAGDNSRQWRVLGMLDGQKG